MNEMTKQNKIIEEAILKEVDGLIERSRSQGERMIYELFKSSILRKYKEAFDLEFAHGEVHGENIDKAVDFCYSDMCVAIGQLPELRDDEKNSLMKEGKGMLPTIKAIVTQIIVNKGIKIIQ